MHSARTHDRPGRNATMRTRMPAASSPSTVRTTSVRTGSAARCSPRSPVVSEAISRTVCAFVPLRLIAAPPTGVRRVAVLLGPHPDVAW